MSKKEKDKLEKDCCEHQDCNCEDDECTCDTITLEMENGTTEDFYVLDVMELKGKNYIALAPLEGDEFYVYGYSENEETADFFPIEDDKEYETIAHLFEQRFAEEEASLDKG